MNVRVIVTIVILKLKAENALHVKDSSTYSFKLIEVMTKNICNSQCTKQFPMGVWWDRKNGLSFCGFRLKQPNGYILFL